MAKVHITLVGGQSMPVYNGIKYSNPDKVVFIYSQQTEKKLKKIKEEFPTILFEDMPPLSSNKLDKILERAKKCRELYKNDEVSLNISGGTKPWAYYFTKVFEDQPNVKIFYIDQNNRVGDLKTTETTEIENNFFAQFRLNENPLERYTLFSEYTEGDFNEIPKVEKIRRVNQEVFTKLTNTTRDKDNQLLNKNGTFYEGSSCISWDKKNNSIKILISNSVETEEIFSSKNVFQFFFNAGWFELKVAKMLSQWEKVKEIYLNCIFPAHNFYKRPGKEFPKNEIDIIVDAGSKIIFVECKTSIRNTTDIDKFKNAVRVYGGQASKALFVVEKNIGNKEMEKMTESRIIPFSLEEMKRQGKDIQEELFKILESELYQSNE